jgi:rod shape-determining protein MreC
MENFFTRYKNPLVLMAVLVIQVIALATQIKRPENPRAGAPGSGGSTRLIRVWTVSAITPFEEALVATGHFFRSTWHNYIDLHDVRRQNYELQKEIERMRLEEARLRNDAEQGRRLQALLELKERYAGPTVAAQVIGSSGSVQSHVIYIDKGSHAGIRQDMAVITPDGIVGKVRDVYPFSAQVLMINDHDSGAGVTLESSRLQGILRGKDMGEIRLNYIMSDEKVEIGERVITSGGDRVYPKGLPVGTVTDVRADPDATPYWAITIKPAVSLNRLEEVLVVTKMAEEAPATPGDDPAHRTTAGSPETQPAMANKPDENQTEQKKPGAETVNKNTPSPQTGSATPQQPPKQPPAQSKPRAGDQAAMMQMKNGRSAEATSRSVAPEKTSTPKKKPTDQPQRQAPDDAEKPPR